MKLAAGLLSAFLVAYPAGAWAQDTTSFPEPNRPVARSLHTGHRSEAERDRLLEAATVFDWLRLDTGKRVAVIGGTGYYTVRAAERLGPSARVWAVEWRPELLDHLRARVERAGLVTVTLVQGEPDDPLLPPSSVDIVIVDHVYHEIPDPFAYFHRLASALAAGARVGVIEEEGPILSHAAPATLVQCELEAVGYEVDNEIPLPGGGYLMVLRVGDRDSGLGTRDSGLGTRCPYP